MVTNGRLNALSASDKHCQGWSTKSALGFNSIKLYILQELHFATYSNTCPLLLQQDRHRVQPLLNLRDHSRRVILDCRPCFAALAACFLNWSCWSSTTPRIFTHVLGNTCSPLTVSSLSLSFLSLRVK
jgi:hypothetical protein